MKPSSASALSQMLEFSVLPIAQHCNSKMFSFTADDFSNRCWQKLIDMSLILEWLFLGLDHSGKNAQLDKVSKEVCLLFHASISCSSAKLLSVFVRIGAQLYLWGSTISHVFFFLKIPCFLFFSDVLNHCFLKMSGRKFGRDFRAFCQATLIPLIGEWRCSILSSTPWHFNQVDGKMPAGNADNSRNHIEALRAQCREQAA